MATKNFIAAIELSSSRVSGIAGRHSSEGSLEVLGYASVDVGNAVYKGVVRNVEKAAQAVKTVVEQLERQIGARVGRVYAGIGGQSLRTVENVIGRQLPQEGMITQDLVDSINDENRQVPLVDMDVLDMAPQEWIIDQRAHAEPVGVMGREVTANFLNVVARSELKRNLELTFEQAGLEVVEIIVIPLASSLAALQDSERLAGCALVDFGADTTTVAIYLANMLRYLAVIPLGGSHITRDLTDLRVMEQEAEQLKRQYADVLYVEPDADQPATCQTADGQTIALSRLCDIAGARAEEIVANVLHQVSLSGYENKLLAGIVLTGGASALRSLEETLRRRGKGHIDKVKTVATPQVKLTGRSNLLPTDGTAIALVGLMMQGREDCRRPDEPQPKQEATQPATPAPTPQEPIQGTKQPTLGEQQISSSTQTSAKQPVSAEDGENFPDKGRRTGGKKPTQPKKPASGSGGKKESPSKRITDFVGRFFGDDETMINR